MCSSLVNRPAHSAISGSASCWKRRSAATACGPPSFSIAQRASQRTSRSVSAADDSVSSSIASGRSRSAYSNSDCSRITGSGWWKASCAQLVVRARVDPHGRPVQRVAEVAGPGGRVTGDEPGVDAERGAVGEVQCLPLVGTQVLQQSRLRWDRVSPRAEVALRQRVRRLVAQVDSHRGILSAP